MFVDTLRMLAFIAVAWLCWSNVEAADEGRDYIATVKARGDLQKNRWPKLASALVATLDCQGVLKGSDDDGQPIIWVAEKNIGKLRSSDAVVRFSSTLPKDWEPVSRLKLSYEDDKPTGNDLERSGLRLIEDYEDGSFIVAEPFNKTIDASLIEKVNGLKNIEYITPLFEVRVIGPAEKERANKGAGGTPKRSAATTSKAPASQPSNDPDWKLLWGMKNINAPKAWSTIHDAPTVIVAVLDSGIAYDHPDITGNMWTDSNGKYGMDFVDGDDNPMDELGHGTHCAGTIGAIGNNGLGVVGVTWKTRIMAVRWINSRGKGHVANAVKAINFAVNAGAVILNNSWWWYDDDRDLMKAIKKANDKGVIFVAASSNCALRANNNRGDNDIRGTYGRYPSSYALPNIIAVAAIDEDENLADFSNWGHSTVHLGAPGVCIWSTFPPDCSAPDVSCEIDPARKGYAMYTGTSMAAAHVSGAVALMLASGQAISSPSDARLKLLKNVRKIPALRGKCVSEGTLDVSFLH